MDKRILARYIGAAVGAIIGIVVAFTFNFAKPDRKYVRPRSPSGSVVQRVFNLGEWVDAGYGTRALFQVALCSGVFGFVGYHAGAAVGKDL